MKTNLLVQAGRCLQIVCLLLILNLRETQTQRTAHDVRTVDADEYGEEDYSFDQELLQEVRRSLFLG